MKNSEEMKRRSIGKEIGILSRAAQKYFQMQFNEYSIGHAQVMTLHFICHNNGLNQNELVHNFNLDKSSVSSQINKLEHNGYIYRETDPNDSRGKRLFISDKTRQIEDDIKQRFSSWSDILLKDFSEEEKESVFLLLDKMKNNAGEFIMEMKKDEENK